MAAAGWCADDAPSEAETLLFLTDHLKNVVPAAKLLYTFRRTGSLETGFDDTIELRVRAEDGAKQVSVAFFTGQRQIAYPDMTHAEGNPVLLYFLERDILEMERLTGGSSLYFQKMIRLALAHSARVAKTKLSYNGRDVAATEITIAPYVDDPHRSQIGKYASKTYVFTLSGEVPGGVYSVRTFVPSASGAVNDVPLLEERVNFVRIAKGT